MREALIVYALMSAVALAMYWSDKRRALRGRRRIPEVTLHAVELAGGWPGAWLAQRVLHHKSIKRGYQIVFWMIVAVHAAGWAWWSRHGATRICEFRFYEELNDYLAPDLRKRSFTGALSGPPSVNRSCLTTFLGPIGTDAYNWARMATSDPMERCPRCGRAGQVGSDRVVKGTNAETVFKCHNCEYTWRVSDEDQKGPERKP